MKNIKLNYSEKKLTNSILSKFLKKYDLNLSNSYKEFILAQNGGVPDLSTYKNTYYEISLFYCIKLFISEDNEQIMSSVDVIEELQINEDELPKYLYPFGEDGGGSTYCISMREEDYGAIYKFYWDGSDMRSVCNSFEEFIDGLE